MCVSAVDELIASRAISVVCCALRGKSVCWHMNVTSPKSKYNTGVPSMVTLAFLQGWTTRWVAVGDPLDALFFFRLLRVTKSQYAGGDERQPSVGDKLALRGSSGG